MNERWHTLVESQTPLSQGDIIENCPVLSWAEIPVDHIIGDIHETLRSAFTAFSTDVIVMNQSCDLEHHKVRNIILCPNFPLSIYKTYFEKELQNRKQNFTDKAWRSHCNDIKDGYIWNLSMLNSEQAADYSAPIRIVNFHEIFTVPRVFLESVIQKSAPKRLRLNSPYREHLSQSFARFFLRVGLPTSIDSTW